MTGVLFLRLAPGCGKKDREVVHLSDPGPDGELVVDSDGMAALRCGGWWLPFAVTVSTENPTDACVDPDYDGSFLHFRLCPVCVKRSTTPIPPPPDRPRAGL